MQRDSSLDIAKGLLIILVVIGHVGEYLSGSLVWLDNTTRWLYGFHMPAFMFISGLLFHSSINRRYDENKKTQSVRAILKKIFLTYGTPYLAFSLVYWVVKIGLSNFAHTQIALTDILLVGIYPFGYLWFLYAVMLMEVVHTLLYTYTCYTRAKYYIPVIAIFLFALQITINRISPGNAFADSILWDYFRNYIYFTVGFYWGSKVMAVLKHYEQRFQEHGSHLSLSKIANKGGVTCWHSVY